jgi:hypothetical protein
MKNAKGSNLFEISDSIIYAQEGIVDCRAPVARPSFIDFQQEVRAAVQSIVNLYCCDLHIPRSKGCGNTKVLNLSDAANNGSGTTGTASELLEEAKKRGYNPPDFDAVMFGILKKKGFIPPFDLDKVLEQYYITRFGD